MMNEYHSIDEYIQNFPQEIQDILQKIRKTISQVAPQATETISYGIPTFKLNGNLVHFAAYKEHIGFYPGPEALTVFAKELSQFETSKGTVQFPLNVPIPYELISKITEFRVQAVLEKKKTHS